MSKMIAIGAVLSVLLTRAGTAMAQERFAVKRDLGPAKGLAAQTGLECLGHLRPRRSEEIGGSPWGVSCHQIADKHALSVRQRLEHLALSGAKWALLCPSWNSIETRKGEYDWNSPRHRLDEVVEGLTARKISPIIQVYGGNRLYTPFFPILPPSFEAEDAQQPGSEIPRLTGDPAAKKAWHAFLDALARRYCREVKVWEVWNEPNISWFWKPQPDAPHYGRMVREVAEIVKRVDPQATVLGGSTALVPLDFFRGLLRSEGAKSLDFASVHPYGAVPENMDGPVRELQRLLGAHGRPAVLWQTECGFPSNADTGGWGYGGPWDETKHAKWVLRRLLCDASLGMKVSIYFTLHDCPSILEGGPDRGRMGVNRKGLHYAFSWESKPAAYAFRHLASLFDDRLKPSPARVAIEILDPGSFGPVTPEIIRTYTLLEKKTQSPVIAYWMPCPMQTQAKSGKVRLRLAGPAPTQPVVVDLLDGRVYRPSRTARTGGATTFENLPLADYPMVLCSRSLLELLPLYVGQVQGRRSTIGQRDESAPLVLPRPAEAELPFECFFRTSHRVSWRRIEPMTLAKWRSSAPKAALKESCTMFRHAPTTMLRLSAACLALTIAAPVASGDGAAPVSTPALPASQDAAADAQFLGDYVGTFHPVGEYGGKPRPGDSKDFKPQKCGSCHTEANIARTRDGFVLTMLIDHDMDKDGRPKKDRITLKGERQGDVLAFGNGNYTIRAGRDEVTGNRSGRMAAEIKLRRKPAGARWGSMKADRILFLGNSITLHGPSAGIGWTGNWGMAASARERDYVHVLVGSLARLSGKEPEVRIENIAEFERHYATYDLARLGKHLDFKPDIVVVAVGENVPALVSEESRTRFSNSFVGLLTAIKTSGQPAIFVRSCFWADKTKDEIMKHSCAAVDAVFVDISGLGKDESNHARSERSFAHAGVAGHPGDQGMKAIADALLKAMTSRMSPTQRPGKSPSSSTRPAVPLPRLDHRLLTR